MANELALKYGCNPNQKPSQESIPHAFIKIIDLLMEEFVTTCQCKK